MTAKHPPGSMKLIADAKTVGRTVIETSSRTVIKRGAHDGVIISESGHLMRYGIDLAVARSMTLKEARKVIALTSK